MLSRSQLPSGKNFLEKLAKNSRILFVRASAVGDVLNVMPSVIAVRHIYPSAHIGFLVDHRSKDLVIDHPAIDKVHFMPLNIWRKTLRQPGKWPSLSAEIREFVTELRAQRYDYSVDFMRNLKGGVLGYLAGAKKKIGLAKPIAKEGNQWMTDVQIKPPDSAIHFTEQFWEFAKYLGAAEHGIQFELPKSKLSQEKVAQYLSETELSKYVVIHPGTSEFGKSKRWPLERFAELANLIHSEFGYRSIIAWGPSEKSQAEEIVANSQEASLLALKTNSLIDLAELIARAEMFIGCDSGPMHISGAVRTPCVAIFGPKDPRQFGPYKHPFCEIVQPSEGIGPTENISTQNVFQAAKRLFARLKP